MAEEPEENSEVKEECEEKEEFEEKEDNKEEIRFVFGPMQVAGIIFSNKHYYSWYNFRLSNFRSASMYSLIELIESRVPSGQW